MKDYWGDLSLDNCVDLDSTPSSMDLLFSQLFLQSSPFTVSTSFSPILPDYWCDLSLDNCVDLDRTPSSMDSSFSQLFLQSSP